MHPFTLADLALQNIPHNRDRTAVICGDDSLTYGELVTQAEYYARLLIGLGIKKRDPVCIHIPKSIDEVVYTVAVSMAGAIVVNVNSLVTPKMLVHAIENSEATVLITSRRTLLALRELNLPSTLHNTILDNDTDDTGGNRVKRWSEITPGHLTAISLIDADPCAIIYTSGSTGRPKGVLLSHNTIVQSARAAATHIQNDSDDRILGILPLSFDYGLSQLTTMMLVGGTLVLPKASMVTEILKTVIDNDVNGLAMVPTMWIPFVRFLQKQGFVMEDVRYVANSGGSLPTDIQKAWPLIFPNARHYLMYGMTEGFRSTYLPPEDFKRKMGSIGKPLPNVELFVVHPENGLCKANEHGELLHRGGLISSGYFKNPVATKEKIKPSEHLHHLIGAEPVLHSEDTVYQDDDGYFWFVARTSSFIKCSDFRVSPTEVEDIVFSSGQVTDVVAFGTPDEMLGHVVNIAVSSSGKPLDRAALEKYCRVNMPNYMVPRHIHEWEGEMPRTANGKIDRPSVINYFDVY